MVNFGHHAVPAPFGLNGGFRPWFGWEDDGGYMAHFGLGCTHHCNVLCGVEFNGEVGMVGLPKWW